MGALAEMSTMWAAPEGVRWVSFGFSEESSVLTGPCVDDFVAEENRRAGHGL